MSLDILQVEKKLLNHNLRLETYFLFGALIRALSKKGKLSKAKKIVSKISYFIKLNKQISVFLYNISGKLAFFMFSENSGCRGGPIGQTKDSRRIPIQCL